MKLLTDMSTEELLQLMREPHACAEVAYYSIAREALRRLATIEHKSTPGGKPATIASLIRLERLRPTP